MGATRSAADTEGNRELGWENGGSEYCVCVSCVMGAIGEGQHIL